MCVTQICSSLQIKSSSQRPEDLRVSFRTYYHRFLCGCTSGKDPSGHVSKVCVCSYVKDGTWKAQDEMGTARGCSALPKVIDQGHQKIIMRTSLTAW